MKKLIIVVLILALVFGGYLYFKQFAQPEQLRGDEVLEVRVMMDNEVPLGKIEVDLWKAGSKGAPNAGFAFTESNGTAIFNIPKGEYEIGFNLNNFPQNLIVPERTYVLVEEGIPAIKIILIRAKRD
jgi:hypothetical protein